MKKNILSVLILVLLIVNLVITSIMMVSVTGTNKKTAELVTSIATVLNLELYPPGQDGASHVSLADTETYDMAEIMVPLAASEDGSKQAYIMFSLSVLQNTKHEDYKNLGGAENMVARDSLIKDVVNRVVGSHTLEECRTDFDSIREELLKEIQKLFGSGFIYKIAISGVKFG